MNNYLKKHKRNLIIIGIYLLIVLLISVINFAGLSIKLTRYLIIIDTFGLSFYYSFKEGKNRSKKGYIGGLKISLIFLLIFNIFNFILIHNPYSLKKIIYYLLFTIINIYASIMGINKKAS